jgi:hypothetical protein
MVRFSLIASLAAGVAFGAVGCNGSSEYKTVPEVKKASPLPDHEHGAKGPHGGGIVELGDEEYHAEIVVDHDSHALSLFVLGKDAKTAELVAAKDVSITPNGKEALTLKAAPQKGDAEGKTSRFELVDNKLVHDLLDAGFLHGELRITIGDKPYLGHIDYHLDGSAHDEHEHDDKKDEAPVKAPTPPAAPPGGEK